MAINNILFFIILFYLFIIQLIANFSNYSLNIFFANMKIKIERNNDIKFGSNSLNN